MIKKRPVVFLINWVTISKKQAYQLKSIVDAGLDLVVFTNDILGESERIVSEVERAVYVKQSRSLFKRTVQLYLSLKRVVWLKYAVLAPAGRFSIVALCILKMFKIPVICIEWGSIASIDSVSWLSCKMMRFCYKYADLIWYKEPYMPPLLTNVTNKPLFFLHNAVESKTQIFRSYIARDTMFLWANRLVTGRYPEWFVMAANSLPCKTKRHAVLMGFLTKNVDIEMQSRCRSLAGKGVVLKDYGDTTNVFPDCRYFVLAAEHVFGNNALLEAMAHGVVPIVTDSIGVHLIIKNGDNGFIAAKSECGLRDVMRKAAELHECEWARMSANAIATVRDSFSVDEWRQGFKRMIRCVQGGIDHG